MIDVNERAVELSNENAERNGVTNVKIYQSDLFSNVDSAQTFASILTNPQSEPEKVVHAIFEKSAEHLKASGELWIVIQKKQGAPSAIEKLEELFDEVSVVQKRKAIIS